jgi:uncharacterized membrane protein YesL
MAGFFGIGNYNKAGAGISKNAPQKGRLKLFFEILGVRIWKIFTLNLIYSLACIPIITIGPATAAMIKVLKNYSIDKNAYVWLDFKEAFRQNFFRALGVGIVDIIAYTGIITGCYIYPTMAASVEDEGKVFYLFFVLTLSVGITFTIMNYYIYLMMVSTDLSMKNIIKNSLALAFLAPRQNLIALASNIILPLILAALIVFVNLQFLFVVPFLPAALVGFIVCFCCYPVVQKYVINPYYEHRGEENPEAPKNYSESDEETLFEDMGGKEKPVDIKKKTKKGKIIS